MTDKEQEEKQEQVEPTPEKKRPRRKVVTGAWWKNLDKDKQEEGNTAAQDLSGQQSAAPVSETGQVKTEEAVPQKKKNPRPRKARQSQTQADKALATPSFDQVDAAVQAASDQGQATVQATVPSPGQEEPGQAFDVSPPKEKVSAPLAKQAKRKPAQPVKVVVSETDEKATEQPTVQVTAATAVEGPSSTESKAQEPAAAAESADPAESVDSTEAEHGEGRQKRKRSRKSGRKKETLASASEEAEDEFHDTVPDVSEEELAAKPKSYKLLINAEEPEECRIALLEDGRLESFHVTTLSREATKNNIYKGRIVSIEANLQAAFVDIGTGRNSFLPFNEIHPEYYRQDLSEKNQQFVNQQQWKKLKIEEVMQKGQEVLVQVVKEVTGNKGANMTTYLSLPGRCLVLMPGSHSAGISRKITGEERRSSLREIMSEFEIPEGIGYIIRTASAEITREALEKDLHNLLALWEEIKQRGQTLPSPVSVYEEQDMVTRFLRDHFFHEIKEIQVDTEESLQNVQDFIDELPKEQQQVKIRLHRGSKPIFNQYNVEEQIESIFRPRVELPSGGSIVIDPTEALVAIDVNSGRTSKNSDFEDTIFLANMEAAAEMSRQLRLRDLGGLIVVDFIDMRNKKHIRDVERQVKVSMKRDKAKVDISRISRFGLMQISRQKMGAPIEKGSYRTCEHCQGRGTVRSVETLSLYYLRRIQTGITRKKVSKVECRLPLEIAQYLLNKKRGELAELEDKHQAKIEIIPQVTMQPADYHIDFLSTEKGNEG